MASDYLGTGIKVRWKAKIEEMSMENPFTTFSKTDLAKNEVDQMFELLGQLDEFGWFEQFMKTRNTLPSDLLKPILVAGGKGDYVSGPKHWMPHLARIYSQEEIDEALFELIRESTISHKCILAHHFYWNGFVSVTRYKVGAPDEELEIIWKWNGKQYVEEYVKQNVEETVKRSKKIKIKRYRFLIKEFNDYDNVVYRYYISLVMPRSVEEFPEELKEPAIGVIEAINDVEFPTSANPLVDKVKGKPELEKLLFEDLGWQERY